MPRSSVFEIEAKLANIAYGTRTLAAIPADAEADHRRTRTAL